MCTDHVFNQGYKVSFNALLRQYDKLRFKVIMVLYNLKNFIRLSCGFMDQSTHCGHVERGQQGSTPQPPDCKSDEYPTEPLRPAIKEVIIVEYSR